MSCSRVFKQLILQFIQGIDFRVRREKETCLETFKAPTFLWRLLLFAPIHHPETIRKLLANMPHTSLVH